MIDTHGITNWRKSSRSNGGGQCVELGGKPGVFGVRDSKNAAGPVLIVSAAAGRTFLESITS